MYFDFVEMFTIIKEILPQLETHIGDECCKNNRLIHIYLGISLYI